MSLIQSIIQGADGQKKRPEDWWNAVCQATKSVLEMVPDAEVSTVAVTGQMMGCLALDKEGKTTWK